MKDGVKNEEQKSKIPYGKIALVIIFVAIAIFGIIFIAKSCTDNGKAALEFRDGNDNVTASIDQQLLSLMVADVKSQYAKMGANIDVKEFWESDDGTFRKLFMDEIKNEAKRLLRAEYYADYVEGTSLDAKQKKKIDDVIAHWIGAYGSEDEFETFLSGYGASIEALRRYMELGLKQKNLKKFMYLDNPETMIKDNQVTEYFGDNYSVIEYIYISLTAGLKANGDLTPLTGAQKAAKLQKRDEVMLELNSGADFIEIQKKYSEADYSKYFPSGYFVPNNGTAQGLDPAVSSEVYPMIPGEIKTVETNTGIYIIKKFKTDVEALKKNPEHFEKIRIMLSNVDFDLILDSDEGIVYYDNVIAELNPALIPSLDVNAMMSVLDNQETENKEE